MKKEILINDVSLDLAEDVVIATTHAINNLQDIYSRQGVYSNSFEVPNTAKNLKTLGYSQNINTVSRIVYKRLRCHLRCKNSSGGTGYTIIYGYAEITSITDKIAIRFTGGNTDFFLPLKDKKLRDLDLSLLNHRFTIDSVTASANNTWQDGYTYPSVDYGKLLMASEVIEFTDLQCAIFYKYLMMAIIAREGFIVKGNFLDNTQFAQQLILSNKAVGYSDEFIKQRSSKAINKPSQNVEFTHTNVIGSAPKLTPVPFNNDSTTPISYDGDLNPFDTLTGKFTAPDYGYYAPLVNIKLDLQIIIGKVKTKVALLKNGVLISAKEQNFKSGLTVKNFTDTIIIGDFGAIYLEPGDIIETHFEVLDNSTTFSYSGTINLDDDSFFQIDLLPNFPANALIEVKEFLPSISVTDFFLNIANQYNLLFSTDEKRRILYINEFNKVSENISRGQFIDWSAKVDYSIIPQLSFYQNGYGQKSTFSYSKDNSDSELKKIPAYGNGNLLFDNENLPIEETVFESVFAATRERLVQRKTRSLPYIPIYEPKENTNYSVWNESLTYFSDPVLDYVTMSGRFFKAIVNNIDGDHPPLNDAGELQFGEWAEVSRKDIFDLFSSNSIQPRTLIRDRSNLKPLQLLDPDTGTITNHVCNVTFTPLEFESNLLPIYYRTLFKSFQNAKFLTCNVRLTDADLANLDFFKPVFIGSKKHLYSDRFNAFFFISSINQYKHGDNESTQVELIKIMPFYKATVAERPPDVNDSPYGLLQENYYAILQETGKYILIETGRRKDILQENGFDIRTEDNNYNLEQQ